MALHTIEFHHLDFFNQLVSLTTHSKSFQWCTSSYLSNVHSRLKVRAQDLFLSDSFSIASYSLLANFCHLFTIYVTLLWNSLNSLLFTHLFTFFISFLVGNHNSFFVSLSTVCWHISFCENSNQINPQCKVWSLLLPFTI